MLAHRSAGAREIDGLDAVAALRHARRVARLSQRDLARRAGVSQSLIARIESRRVDPPVGQMQRLLGLCGMRWELRLVGGGVSPAGVAARSAKVRRRTDRRYDAAITRRMKENAAARDMGAALDGSMVTVRERRRRCREARLAQRAAQAALYGAVVRADDAEARGWVSADAQLSQQRCADVAARRFGRPLRDRLIEGLGDREAADLRRLLDPLAGYWCMPPVAITGSLARAVWSPPDRPRAGALVELAPLPDQLVARAFLDSVGAVTGKLHQDLQLGSVRLRLTSSPPQSATLVTWRPGRPSLGLVVARPESRPGPSCDRHAVRAALATASRDRRGRRRPPYHETVDGALSPWWVGPADAELGRGLLRAKQDIGT